MGNKAEYRSAKRSRDKICNAFLELLKEKDLDKITVTDIVTKAKVNRSTFYAHYPDVNGVLEAFEEDTVKKMVSLLEQFQFDGFFENPELLLSKVNIYFNENMPRYKTLLFHNKKTNRFLHRLAGIFYDYMKKDTSVPEEIRLSPSFDTRLKFFAGGIVEVYERWFEEGQTQDLDMFSKEISSIIKESTIYRKKSSRRN